MKFLLLGAGASKAYSESPTGVRMPIAKDFFSTFSSLKISNNPWVLVDGLMDFIIRVKGENPAEFFSRDVDIEELYTEIEENLNIVSMQRLAHQRCLIVSSICCNRLEPSCT